jgi:unsaturated chondroitin disaccharide hydrolase
MPGALAAALVLCGLILPITVPAEPHLRGIKVAVTNLSAEERQAEPVVISIPELRRIAPDLRAGSLIVTVTRATDLQQDAAAIQATEIPSQVDDLDNDGKADELVFQLDLKAHETCMVTITYGEPGRIYKIRGDYPPQTDALFARKLEGLGWESEKNAWRLYFDRRNAIDLYGKRRSMLMLKRFATPEYDYHADVTEGRDTYLVGSAMGIGAVGAWREGALIKVSDVQSRGYRIIATGPVRAMAELTYEGWNAGGHPITLRNRITQWAGDRGFYQTITTDAGPGFTFATGIPLKKEAPARHSNSGRTWLASWGEQVLKPGATATEPISGTNLGLGVVMISPSTAAFVDDPGNHLLTFSTQSNSASWYTLAAWDQEGSDDRFDMAGGQEFDQRASLVTPHPGIQNREQFTQAMQQLANRMDNPVQVKILSSAPAPQSGPVDTLQPTQSKTYSQALALLQQEIDRTAAAWEPIIAASKTGDLSSNKGLGFFTDGDSQSGEWKKHNGFFWTGSFWVGELWNMYAHTRDEKYRRWAQLWNSRLLGLESQQNHDAGFLYYYSSVAGFGLTGSPDLKESGLRAAERLRQLFNPGVHLLPAWDVHGDDTIVDTMMNLQLLWWASEQTGDPKWREIGLEHARRTAEWFVRPDGSIVQSVHYNPGDGRQRLQLHGGTSHNVTLDLANDAKPGGVIFTHTHQGLASGTTWSRGAAWALYGFSRAYAATHDPNLLLTAQKIGDYILAELPADGVPWFDFDDEGVHYRNRDSSAAAIIAGGLLSLSREVADKNKAAGYREQSRRITQSLIDRYLTPVEPGSSAPPGILRHGCGTRPADEMLIYGQYYLLETLLALQEDEKKASTSGGAQ